MTTRATQIDLLLSGIVYPATGAALAGGTVYFYTAGTSNTKNVWTEKEKSTPYTEYTLDSYGRAQLYGEGIYKFIIKDSTGSTIYTWDNIKIEAVNHYVNTQIADYAQTTDDDWVLVNTDSGNKTISMLAAASFNKPCTFKNIGSNSMILDPYGSELIDGASSLTVSVENTSIEVVSDGTTLYKSLDSSWTADITASADEINLVCDDAQMYLQDAMSSAFFSAIAF